ncbi:hypothetical protein AC1031_012461 [Aphanomyces cochlioides]|nr:hypothetical protein AC1031_012461 [Aphanomyces cochlioides]
MRIVAVVPSQARHKWSDEALSRAKRSKALGRIVINLSMCAIIVFLSSVMFVVDAIGFFHRQTILDDLTMDAQSMKPYAQSCRMNDNGDLCVYGSRNDKNESAWTAIGQQLAVQWQAISSSPYFVTTCIKNKPTSSNHTALVFLAGYDLFPQCQPSNGQQEIAGMAMLETTVRDEFQDGAYMLTVFADKTMSESLIHVNSDGSTDLLIANINQTLIAIDGSVTVDTVGINGVQSTVPLGEFFNVSTYSYPVVLDITSQVNSTRLDGWNVGRKSKKAVIMTWDQGHHVENRHLLVTFQVYFSARARC